MRKSPWLLNPNSLFESALRARSSNSILGNSSTFSETSTDSACSITAQRKTSGNFQGEHLLVDGAMLDRDTMRSAWHDSQHSLRFLASTMAITLRNIKHVLPAQSLAASGSKYLSRFKLQHHAAPLSGQLGFLMHLSLATAGRAHPHATCSKLWYRVYVEVKRRHNANACVKINAAQHN